MSATRTPLAERGTDYYATPAWVVEALVPHLPPTGEVLDPCAGTGAILTALDRPQAWGLELVPELARQAPSHDIIVRDALAPEPWRNPLVGGRRPPLIVMNPPFARAEEFVRRALDEVAPGGTVAALLRLGFLEGMRRIALHRERPADVLVLPRRPSFTGRGTDASAYGWLVWGPGRGGRWSILDVAPARGEAAEVAT